MSHKRNKTKSIIFKRSVTALVILFVLSQATIAWLVSQQDVSGEGMNVKMEAGTGLVIEDDPTKLSGSTKNIVEFENLVVKNLVATTHTWNNYPAADTNLTGLIYNSNPNAVSVDTGYAKTNTTLEFRNVPVNYYKAEYFVDYNVYFASLNDEFEISDFITTMEFYNRPSVTDLSYLNATSIDFYIQSVSEQNYRGTLNLAGVDYSNPSVAKTEVNLVKTGETVTVPQNGTGYIPVIMRCYFDGNLPNTSGTAYVHARGLTLYDFGIRVNFEAVKK